MKPISDIPGLWVDGDNKPMPNGKQERERVVECLKEANNGGLLDIIIEYIEAGKHWGYTQ